MSGVTSSGIKRKASEELKRTGKNKKKSVLVDESSSYLVGSSASSSYCKSLNYPRRHKHSTSSSEDSYEADSSDFTASVPTEQFIHSIVTKCKILKQTNEVLQSMTGTNRRRLMTTLGKNKRLGEENKHLREMVITLSSRLIDMSAAMDVMLGLSEPDDLSDLLKYQEEYTSEAINNLLSGVEILHDQ